jgi:hypothetical protein
MTADKIDVSQNKDGDGPAPMSPEIADHNPPQQLAASVGPRVRIEQRMKQLFPAQETESSTAVDLMACPRLW